MTEDTFTPEGSQIDTAPSPDVPEVLQSTIDEISAYTGISQKTMQRLNKKLPIVIEKDASMAQASHHTDYDEHGKPVSFISFSSSGMQTGDDWMSRWARTEETTHHLQRAVQMEANPSGFKAELDLRKRERYAMHMYDMGKSDSAAIVDKVLEYSDRELTVMCARLGIDKPTIPTEVTPENSDQIMDAINYALDMGARWDSKVRLTVGQMARLNTKLTDLGIKPRNSDLEFEILDYEMRLKEEQARALADQDEGHFDLMNKRSRQSETEKGILRTTQKRVTEAISQGVTTAQIKEAMDSSHIRLDTFSYKFHKISQQIEAMSATEVQSAIMHLLSEPATFDELLYFSELTNYGVDGINAYEKARSLAKSANQADVQRAETLREELQQRTLSLLQSVDLEEFESKGKYVITQILRGNQRSAVAQATTEKNLFWFTDDLPSDEVAKQNLLSNPVYLREYEDAVVKALQDPDLHALGELGFNPETAAKDQLTALAATRKALNNAKIDPDLAAFLHTTQQTLEHQRGGLGTTPDWFEWSTQRHIDTVLLEMGISLSRIPTESQYQDARDQAFREANQFMQDEYQSRQTKNMSDLVIEPIAKCISAQVQGLGIDSIVYPESMMGGYSVLLRELLPWTQQVWEFTEKVHAKVKSGQQKEAERAMLDFLGADFQTQKSIVANFR